MKQKLRRKNKRYYNNPIYKWWKYVRKGKSDVVYGGIFGGGSVAGTFDIEMKIKSNEKIFNKLHSI